MIATELSGASTSEPDSTSAAEPNDIPTSKLGGASALDDAWLAALVRRRNREMHDGTRRVAKKRLLPAYLALRRERPELLAQWGAPVGGSVDARVVRLLRAKPRRTASGVATITVLTKPWPCSGSCVFCPNDMRMPKSYLADEPACQRAERCCFDPYVQVLARLRVLEDMGHVTDKVELIVLGGTWSDYPRSYQLWFISELFRALNESGTPAADEAGRRRIYEQLGIAPAADARTAENGPSAPASPCMPPASCVPPSSCAPSASCAPVEVARVQRRVDAGELTYNEAWALLYGEGSPWEQAAHMQRGSLEELERQQRANEQAAHRCVGLVVETRPDMVTPQELAFLRQLGCTKVQVGIQSLDETTLSRCGRPAPLAQTERAFALLRLFGFKSHVHLMVNLPGATPADDAREYRLLMDDERFRPDELKLYPCCLVASARLGTLMERGQWKPYEEAELVELLAQDVMATNPYARISRMIRDISATDIVAGNKKTNLRQMVEARVLAGTAPARPIGEMRLREIGTAEVDPNGLHLETLAYRTTVSEERFLQWVDAEGRLAAFLRLSLPEAAPLRKLRAAAPDLPDLPDVSHAMIREVHVYGKVAPIGTAGSVAPEDQNAAGADEGAQHAGLGRALVADACAQAEAAGYAAVNVISAVGTRAYYRALGFEDAGLYQRKPL